MPPESSEAPLQIRLLGEMQVARHGGRLELPPSKKTRALLGYLLLTSRRQRRDRLCELFWDVADDPRAALRWSLSKLRELLDDPARPRLLADREHVEIDASGAWVDVLSLRKLLASGPEQAETATLEASLPLFRGELLEGLDLPEFQAYHAFCVAERSVYRELRLRTLRTLIRRGEGDAVRVLPHLRALVLLDPVDTQARAELLERLKESGRAGELAAQKRVSERLFSAPEQAAAGPTQRERSSLLSLGHARPRDTSVPFVGRARELAQLEEAVQAGVRFVLIVGDPAIGKSRLLAELLERQHERGARVRKVSVPEGRLGFPYAPLRELLQTLGEPDAPPLAAAASFAGEESSAVSADAGREALFRSVAAAFVHGARARRLLLAIEDVQWLDAGSLALLSYLADALGSAPVTVLLTARRGELHDQLAVRRALRVLKREGRLLELALGPLGVDDTAQLIAAVAAPCDHARVLRESAGHPLFALELARHGEQPTARLPASLVELIRDRVAALPAESVDLLRWASVLGSTFDSDTLGRLLSHSSEELVEALEQLERHGLLALDEAGVCRFAHELVHRAVYDQQSEPRRRLMHARVARLAFDDGPLDGERAGRVAHHAALGGDPALAARACLAAARHCTRLFALPEALRLARRGLPHAAALSDPERTTLSLELLEVAIQAERPVAPDLSVELAACSTRALDLGATAHARRGFFLRAVLTWEAGRVMDAERFAREAERISRAGSLEERMTGLADSARCLICLEQELPEAEALLLEAEALAGRAERGLPNCALLTRGMLHKYRGEYEPAAHALEQASQRARASGERLEEFYALEELTDLELQRGRYARAGLLSDALCELGERLRQGSELPLARAMRALARYAEQRGGQEELDFALAALAHADAKQRSALVASRAAEYHLAQGELVRARAFAEQALELARVIARSSEAYEAHALLVCIATQSQDRALFECHAAELARVPLVSAHTRRLVTRAREIAGEESGAQLVRAPRGKKGALHGARHRRTKVE